MTSRRPRTDTRSAAGASRLLVRDALREAYLTSFRRPGRALLTALATVLGVGTVVATIGVLSTARQEVAAKFNAVASTQVTVTDLGAGNIPLSAERNVLRIRGVHQAGISWQISSKAQATADPAGARAAAGTIQVPLFGATPQGLAVTGAKVLSGRLFDAGDEHRANRVALLGTVAANNLGITTVVNQPAVFVDGVAFTVVGIVGGLTRQPAALTGITIPATTAEQLVPITQANAAGTAGAARAQGPTSASPALFVTTDLGAAQVVGGEIAYAVNPAKVPSLSVAVPPDPQTLRRAVEGITASLSLLLAGLALVIGFIAIANTTLLTVFERIPEIGLRRALGALPRHIATATVLEAAMTGLLGGILGTALGVITVAAIAFVKTWTAVLDVRVVIAAPLAGLLIGALAGLYPARRATKVEPIDALQRA